MNDKYRTTIKKRHGVYVLQSMNEDAPLPFFDPAKAVFRANIMEVPSFTTPKEAMEAWCAAIHEAYSISRCEGMSLTECPVRTTFVWEEEVVTTKLTRTDPNA